MSAEQYQPAPIGRAGLISPNRGDREMTHDAPGKASGAGPDHREGEACSVETMGAEDHQVASPFLFGQPKASAQFRHGNLFFVTVQSFELPDGEVEVTGLSVLGIQLVERGSVFEEPPQFVV